MRKLLASGVVALSALFAAGQASAAGGKVELQSPAGGWSFSGPFGTYDRGAAQRGFQVYKEVCASCHGLSMVAYRNLMDLGLSENAVKAIAAEYQIPDFNDRGEAIERPGKPSDRFRKPFPNQDAAKAANGGAYPPDLSLMVKARDDGANYVYTLLLSYVDFDKLTDADKKKMGLAADFKLGDGKAFNKIFHPGEYGFQIAMAQPLRDGQVTYVDGTKNDLPQLTKDLVTFLAWASEPKMEQRKRTGVAVVLFLIVFAGVMYAAKRKIWADAH